MPVTAKLSRRFYEQFGDEVTNELVNWFNAVDETYRNQLRELNELNWERFRAELRAVEAAVSADVAKQLAEMDKRLDTRFSAIEARFGAIEARSGAIEGMLGAMDTSLASINDRFPTFEERLEAKFDAKFAKLDRRMFKTMFWFWTATIVPLGALIVTLSVALQ